MSDKHPIFDIVIPHYNRPRELVRLYHSIVSSEYRAYSITVVDDASQDNCLAEISRLPVTIIRQNRNQGPASARNLGAASTEGEILFFVDSDVEVFPDTLTRLADRFGKFPEVDCIVAIPGLENRFKNPSSIHFTSRIYYNYLTLPDFISFTCSTAVAVKRRAFGAIGGFNEEIKSASVEDGELGLDLHSNRFKIYLDKENPVAHHKKINLWGLLKNDFKRTRAKILSRQFAYRLSKVKSGRFGSIPVSHLGAIFSSYLLLIAMVLISLDRRFGLIALLALGGVLAAHQGYLRFIAHQSGLVTAGQVLFIIILDSLVVGLSLAVSVLRRSVNHLAAARKGD